MNGNELINTSFVATQSSGEVSAIYVCPRNAKWLLVFAHGAGVDMNHKFMDTASSKLADHGIATFRFNFPYMEKGKRSPDPQPILKKTIRSAIETASGLAGGLPIIAGGKSLGGRMTSMAVSESPIPNVRGLVLFGFPLHAPGKPSADRAAHLMNANVPMLFMQGTRDNLADLNLLKPVCRKLGDRATLHIVEGGDHSFHSPKNAGRSDEEVIGELAKTVSEWSEKLRG
jgi:predicted alpha/beta-hydrolase family hydrolase